MTPLFLPAVPLLRPPANEEVAAAWQALRERELEFERRQRLFDEEQKLLRNYWRQRHQDEWDRLRAEANRLAESAGKQRRKLQEKATELEMRRREQEQERNAFAAEKAAWRDQAQRQQAELQEQRLRLEAGERQLAQSQQEWRQARLDGERLRHGRDRELEGLEKRIVGYRHLLQQLQTEVGALEQRVAEAGELAAPLPTTELPGMLAELLEELTATLDELFHEQLRLTDSRDELAALREAWTLEWEKAQTELAQQEEELRAEAEGVRERHLNVKRLAATVNRQAEDVAMRRQAALAQEEEMRREETEFRCAQAQAAAELRAKTLAARTRQRQAERLLGELHREELKRLARFEMAERTMAVSQRALFDRHEQLDMRETWLDQREKDVSAREWVVDHAEQQLVGRDPHPKQAEAELNRRLDIFAKLAERAERRDLDRGEELSEALRNLDAFRQRLLAGRAEQDAERVQLQLLRLTTIQEREQIESERQGWRAALRQLKAERRRLREQNRDLHEQVERLTLALMEPKEEGLRLAA